MPEPTRFIRLTRRGDDQPTLLNLDRIERIEPWMDAELPPGVDPDDRTNTEVIYTINGTRVVMVGRPDALAFTEDYATVEQMVGLA